MQTLIILGVYSTYLHFKSILNFQRTKSVDFETSFLSHPLPNLGRRASHEMVGPDGLEPSTPRLSSACSNQLSYEPKIGNWRSTCLGPCFGGADEIRTRDPLLAKQVLYQLSYDPIQVKTVMLKELAYQNLLCAIN